jgi:hypothetical protein
VAERAEELGIACSYRQAEEPVTISVNRLIAATIASEVPPPGTTKFTPDQIALARLLVAEVIHHRAASQKWGHAGDAYAVITARLQFSAVLREEYWFKAVLGEWFPGHVDACATAWDQVNANYSFKLPASVLNYYSPISMKPAGAVPPWAAGLVYVPVPALDPDYFRFYRLP